MQPPQDDLSALDLTPTPPTVIDLHDVLVDVARTLREAAVAADAGDSARAAMERRRAHRAAVRGIAIARDVAVALTQERERREQAARETMAELDAMGRDIAPAALAEDGSPPSYSLEGGPFAAWVGPIPIGCRVWVLFVDGVLLWRPAPYGQYVTAPSEVQVAGYYEVDGARAVWRPWVPASPPRLDPPPSMT